MSDEDERQTTPPLVQSVTKYRVACALSERKFHTIRFTLSEQEQLIGIHAECLQDHAGRAAGLLGAQTCHAVVALMLSWLRTRPYGITAPGALETLHRLLAPWLSTSYQKHATREFQQKQNLDEWRAGRDFIFRCNALVKQVSSVASVISYTDGRLALQLPAGRKRSHTQIDPQTIAYRNQDRVWVRREVPPGNFGVDRGGRSCLVCPDPTHLDRHLIVDSSKASLHRHSKSHVANFFALREALLKKLPGVVND